MDREEIGQKVGERLWRKARVKHFLGDPVRRPRVVVQSLAEYIDRRIERIDRPDPLPSIHDTDHSGPVVWGERRWELPIGPDEARGDGYIPCKARTSLSSSLMPKEVESIWVYTYRAVQAALSAGLFRVSIGSGEPVAEPARRDPIQPDPVIVYSERPLEEDEDGRVPSYLADVVDRVLYAIHNEAVDQQIQRARSFYSHAPVTPAVDKQTGEVLNLDQLNGD